MVIFILDRTYVEPACARLLTSVLPPAEGAGLRGRPSTVLDGSSARGCASRGDRVVRQSGVISAGLASAPVIRTEDGKMETGT